MENKPDSDDEQGELDALLHDIEQGTHDEDTEGDDDDALLASLGKKFDREQQQEL